MNPLFTSLKLWIDPIPRPGPENMAVDDWLLETSDEPVLRIYEWEGSWGSLGHFSSLKQSIESFDPIHWVRRSTGGGVVDHQNDWTYTLVIPETDAFSKLAARTSYRLVHQILANALSDRLKLSLTGYSPSEPGGVCFQNPVEFDLIDPLGNKIAGAGQRRTRHGLLHQGSVKGKIETKDSIDRSKRFASLLSSEWSEFKGKAPMDWIDQRVASKYGNPEWTRRR